MLSAKIPARIDHGHIIDSVVEIRFVPKNEQTAFLEILASIRDVTPNFRFVPTEIPKQIRDLNPQLKWNVEAAIIGDKFSVGIGSNAIVFNCQNGYKTWNEFFPFITSVLGRIGDHITKVIRIGVRFTNFFEGNNDLRNFNVNFNAGLATVFDKTAPKLTQMVVKFTVTDTVSHNVTVASGVTVPNRTPGTLVDVDTFVETGLPSTTGSKLNEYIEMIHEQEKQMFFSLLEKTFLDSLNPKYQGQ